MTKILVIDDEASICAYLPRMIPRFGFEVDTAPDATTGIAKVNSGEFRMVISDIGLPDAPLPLKYIDDLATAAEQHDCKVVLISGAPSEEITRLAGQRNILTFLSKPFELAFIKNTLQSVFGTDPAAL